MGIDLEKYEIGALWLVNQVTIKVDPVSAGDFSFVHSSNCYFMDRIGKLV